jgi:hypothetical protein
VPDLHPPTFVPSFLTIKYGNISNSEIRKRRQLDGQKSAWIAHRQHQPERRTFKPMGEITIDRTLYNIRYGSGKFFGNLGDKMIYDDFVLQFRLVLKSN